MFVQLLISMEIKQGIDFAKHLVQTRLPYIMLRMILQGYALKNAKIKLMVIIIIVFSSQHFALLDILETIQQICVLTYALQVKVHLVIL